MTRTVFLIALFVTAGCLPATEPVIADLEESKVTIQATESKAAEAVFAKATEGCAIHRRIPLYLSTGRSCESMSCSTYTSYYGGGNTSCIPTDCHYEHLFACVAE